MLRRSVKPVSELVQRISKNEFATPSSHWSGICRSIGTDFADEMKGPTYNFKLEKSRRLVNPPQFKAAADAYCHYPILIVASPTIGNTTGYKNVPITPRNNACTFTKDYFVDVPFEVCPGELIRVLIAGDEYLVKCPDISRPGERIALSMVLE